MKFKIEDVAAAALLPKDAQEIFTAAVNRVMGSDNLTVEQATPWGWAAVNRKFKKVGDAWQPLEAKDTRSISLVEDYEADALVIDARPRKTNDGYMVAHAKVGRTGIQLYRGDEMGLPDMKVVRVYRPAEEVFDSSTIRSMAYKPVTLDHPPEEVTADNWKKYSRGNMGADILRDGKFVSVPMLAMDRELIDAIETKQVKQLSLGYTMDLNVIPGVSPEGEAFDAFMSNIRINHLAVVRAARGGPELRIGDKDKETKMGNKTFKCDSVDVTMDETAAQIVERALTDRQSTIDGLKSSTSKVVADLAALQAKYDTLTTDSAKAKSESEGKIAALEQKVKDAQLTPDQIEAKVREFAEVRAKARGILGDAADLKGKDLAEIKKLVVAKKLGDAKVKDANADFINAAFDGITADVKIDASKIVAADIASGIENRGSIDVTDAEAKRQTAYDKLIDEEANAWKPKEAKAA